MAVSNSAGNLQTRYPQDALGNVTQNVADVFWTSNSASDGWHHNTKELAGEMVTLQSYRPR